MAFGYEFVKSAKLLIINRLRKQGFIRQEFISIINELRILRNKAVHEMEFEIEPDQVVEFINLSLRVVRYLREDFGQ